MKQYYDWQKKAVERFKDAAYFALNAACGTGKTLAAILISAAKNLPTIVIAPTHSLCDQWKKDIAAELGEDVEVWVYNRQEEVKEGEEKYRKRFMSWLYS